MKYKEGDIIQVTVQMARIDKLFISLGLGFYKITVTGPYRESIKTNAEWRDTKEGFNNEYR